MKDHCQKVLLLASISEFFTFEAFGETLTYKNANFQNTMKGVRCDFSISGPSSVK